ncbi:MAG: hypothetical protein H0T79_12145 [Deltaproteobacteria bacterium]|nr:hypothetical protein [Deltaproteobacteria bacterium]
MRALLLSTLAITACWKTPSAPRPIAAVAPPRPATVTPPRRTVAQLTPREVVGAELGQALAELLRARPRTAELQPPEGYDFRDHYVEQLDADGIETVHYYVQKDGGAMYQISFDFTDPGPAAAMWQRYVSMGREIEDLGGREIVIEMQPFEVRVWHNELRVQIMAVIEGTEWWSQYHGRDDDDSAPDDPDAP